MKYAHKDIDTEVIDNTLYLSKWDGEATFSIKHSGKINHYSIRKPQPTGKLRWLNLGGIDPIEVPIEYELSRHQMADDIQISTYWSNKPALMYFGSKPASEYVGKVDIPELRAASRIGNPYYMDDGLVMFDIHYNGHERELSQPLNQAIQEILKEQYDIDTFNKGKKLYYKDPVGNDVKISSPETAEDHTWTYLNLDTEYNTYLKYSTSETPRDTYAYGLKRNYPDISKEVVPKIVERFGQLIGLMCKQDNYTSEELREIERLKPFHTDPNWIREAQRDDPDWTYCPDEGHEYAIILDSKPDSNVIPLEVESANLVFAYQPKEVGDNEYRPVQVQGSYAAYHADESKHHNSEKYLAGKAFHIYAPVAIAADGTKIKCAFDPDWDGSDDLEITIPQGFLDNAVYPVTIDPVFGYTAAGASQFQLANNGSSFFAGLLAQTGNANTYKVIGGFITTSDGGGVTAWQYAIYLNSTNALIASTPSTSRPTGTGSKSGMWLTTAITTPPTLSATSYNLIAQGQANAQYDLTNLYYDTVTNAGQHTAASQTYTTFPSTEPTMTADNNKYSLYAATLQYIPGADFFMFM